MSEMNDPYFNETDGSKAFPPNAPSTGRGCLFYGCLGVLVVGALGAVLLASVSFLALRYGSRLIEEYTATRAEPVPIVELPAEQVEAIEHRLDEFQTSVEADQGATLRLTAEEINALIARNPNLSGRLAVEIEGDVLRGKLSFPLEELGLPRMLLGGLKGRYLNGEARFRPILVGEGLLRIQIDELIVKGEPVPQEFLDNLNQGDNVIHFDREDREGKRDLMRSLERIDVEDGAVVLRARARKVPPNASVDEAPQSPNSNADFDADPEHEPSDPPHPPAPPPPPASDEIAPVD